MKAIICVDIASLYKEAAQSELIDEALFGMTVDVLAESAGYCKVRTHYRYEGWTAKTNLLCGENTVELWDKLTKKLVFTPYIDVLCAPDVCATRIASMPRGAVLAVQTPAMENLWQEVCLPNGDKGYTKANYLRDMPLPFAQRSESAVREAVCQNALAYLGAQYRWGGKTPLGIDCSGLASMAYMLEGVCIYRDAAIKTDFPVREIAYKDAQKGDLLYFPGHVALYLGNDNFVHSTQHKGTEGVVLASLCATHALYRADLQQTLLATGSIF